VADDGAVIICQGQRFVRDFFVGALLAVVVAGGADATESSGQTGDNGRIRTQLVAGNDVVVSSQIAARIARLTLKPGDAFRKGETLVVFDCDQYRAQQSKADATAAATDKQFQITQRLAQLHSVGELDVEQAQAKAKEAAADATYMRTMVAGCRIEAPFDGRVVKREAASFEYVTPGKPLIEILDTSQLEVQLIVPSAWLRWLQAGAPFTVHVDDVDLDVPAEVIRIGAAVDPVSQTITLSGRIKKAAQTTSLLPGMSGWAQFPKRQ
jgi:RND family efflux transporter MFP subunit